MAERKTVLKFVTRVTTVFHSILDHRWITPIHYCTMLRYEYSVTEESIVGADHVRYAFTFNLLIDTHSNLLFSILLIVLSLIRFYLSIDCRS